MVEGRPNISPLRTWIDRIPVRWLALAWLAAGAFSLWWMYGIWTGWGVLYMGHKIALAFWTLPVLPLFALTWRWLERRRGRPWFAWAPVAAWAALMAARYPPQLRGVLDGTTSRVVISP